MKRNMMIIVLTLLISLMSGCTGEQKSVAGDASIATPTAHNTNGNMQNGGLMTYDAKHLYFLIYTGNGQFGFTKSGTDKRGLYQANPDGSNTKLIGATSINNCLNVYHGAVYGVGYGGIYAVDLRTGKEKRIIACYDFLEIQMQIAGNKLYYTDGTTIYAANLNGSSKTKIVSGPAPEMVDGGSQNTLWHFAINGSDLYYTIDSYYQPGGTPKETKLYKKSLGENRQTDKGEIIYKGYHIYNIQFLGNKVYYLDLDNLDSGYNGTTSLYKNGVKLKNGSSISSYHILKDKIYFMRYDKKGNRTLIQSDLNLSQGKVLYDKIRYPIEESLCADQKSIFWYPSAESIKMLNLKTHAVKPFFDIPSEDN